jgi:hypothetical protein
MTNFNTKELSLTEINVMNFHWTNLLLALSKRVRVFGTQAIAQTENDPDKTPLYWSTYEFNIIRQHLGSCYNYIPEYTLQANVDWVDGNLKNFGYNMIEIDGCETVGNSMRTAIAPPTLGSGNMTWPGGLLTCSRAK